MSPMCAEHVSELLDSAERAYQAARNTLMFAWPMLDDSLDDGRADDLHDAEKDRLAERLELLHPAPTMRPGGPCARAVARAEARMNGAPTDAQVAAMDSMFGSAS